MDIGRIAVRAAFAFIFLLVLVRLSGKRTVAQGTAVDFVLALIFGDLVDDVIWAEVAAAQFVVAIGTLFAIAAAVRTVKWRTTVQEQ